MATIVNKLQSSVAVALVAAVALTMLYTSCDKTKQIEVNYEDFQLRIDSLVIEGKFDDCLAIIDSLEQAKAYGMEIVCNYRGRLLNAKGEWDQAEKAYRQGIEAGKKEISDQSHFIACYMNLAILLREYKEDNEGAVKAVTEALDLIKEWKKNDQLKDFDMIVALQLYSVLGGIQYETGNTDEALKTFDNMWELQQKLMETDTDKNNCAYFTQTLRDVCLSLYNAQNYKAMGKWLDCLDEVFARYKSYYIPQNYELFKVQKLFFKGVYLAETGKRKEASEAYDSLAAMDISKQGGIAAAWKTAILRRLGRYEEAAKNSVEALEFQKSYYKDHDSEGLAINLATSYQLFRLARQDDKALELGDELCAIVDSVIFHLHRDNAAKLATIYDTKGKEQQIAEQQISLSRQRWMGTLIALVLLTTFFILYTLHRRKAQKRLAAAHQQLETAHTELQTAYNQLEETTAAKERIESELRIARDIQMSMVPGVFPEYEGLDMFASMTPAKEVGGDLYGYVMQGEKLYFCVGDVSGKGVPASLFMAQSSRLFRTLATEGMMPADIAFRMNNALSENNDRGMFVTMFIGLLHLETGRLDYCNCGHNPPVIDGQFLNMQYENLPLGLLEDNPFEGETIDDIRGRQLLIYTDGLNEAENQQKDFLGNERLLELMADASSLDSRQVIDMLNEAVEQHRAGAEPNDDLTLMCLMCVATSLIMEQR
jgi:serine phosphatase RsbU (regulator of sigma subunit)